MISTRLCRGKRKHEDAPGEDPNSLGKKRKRRGGRSKKRPQVKRKKKDLEESSSQGELKEARPRL